VEVRVALLKEEGIENAHASLEGVGDAQGVAFGFFGFGAGEQFVDGGAEEGDPAFEVFLFQGEDHVFGHGLAFKGHGAEKKGAPEGIHGGQVLGPIDLRQVIEDGAQQRVGVHFVVKAVDQIFDILFCGDILHLKESVEKIRQSILRRGERTAFVPPPSQIAIDMLSRRA
jgi:hypothetical protein